MSTRMPTLRQRQAEELRASLRAAFIALVLERGATGFSLHDVASVAGVSDRTLYRHYPSREALIEGVTIEEAAELERDRRDDVEAGTSILEDPEVVAHAFERFERHGDLMRALRMLRASGEENPASAERTRQAREQLRAAGVHPAALDQLTALLRLITGGDAWARMTEPDLALDAREAGYAAQWATQVLLRAGRDVNGSLRPTTGEPDDAAG